jgi:nitric oxide reductase large subunit
MSIFASLKRDQRTILKQSFNNFYSDPPEKNGIGMFFRWTSVVFLRNPFKLRFPYADSSKKTPNTKRYGRSFVRCTIRICSAPPK